MKTTTRMPNGKLKVNKAAIIARLVKARKKQAIDYTVMHASQVEIDREVAEMTRYSADSLRNHDEI